MKKRAKIITTVASLCLAVALMAFGVYAATQVTLTISSNVKFEVTDIFVTVNGYAKQGAIESEGVPGTDEADYNYVSYNTVNGQKVATDSNTANDDESWAVDLVEYTSANNVVTYTLIIENDSAQDAVDVTLDLTMANVAGTYRKAVSYSWSNNDYATAVALSSHTAETGYSASATGWTITDTFTIAAGAKLKLVFVRTLEDTATTLNSTSSLAGTVVMTKHVSA